MFLKLSRIDELVLNKYYTWFFKVCVYTGFIKYTTYLFTVGSKSTRIVNFYFRKLHPFFLIILITYLPTLLLPVLGIFWYLDRIINLPNKENPAKDIIMSRQGKIKGKLRALRREYFLEHPEDTDDVLNSEKHRGVTNWELWTEEDWEEYYQQRYSGVYSSGKKKAANYSETPEIKPLVEVKTWKGEVDNSIEEEIPEDEIRIDNLYNSLQKGYINSVERFFKKKCNIYPTDFGYAMERINRDKSRIYLDINFQYVKIWEGEDKIELLKTLIKDLEKGFIQRTTKDLLINILDQFDVDVSVIPNEKLTLLEKNYKVGCIPNDLNLVKARK